VLGGVAGGALVQKGGYAAVFLAASGMAVIATICCWISRSIDRQQKAPGR
jgi:predicted MFS family arabinose efflux permease